MITRFAQVLKQPKPLTVLLAASSCFFLISLSGPIICGDPLAHHEQWIKLTKFSASFFAYALTMSWLGNNLFQGKKLFERSAMLACFGAIVDLIVIYGQALMSLHPHTDYHNTATLISRLAILPVTWLIIVTYAIVLKDKNTNPVLRSGLLWATSLVLIGCIPAILMLIPATATNTMSSHHPGIPFLGWSTIHGDLRIAHFVGVHALQVMPAVAWLATKCENHLTLQQQLRLVSNIGFLTLSLIILLTAQALLGESFFASNVLTLCAIALSSTILFILVKTMYFGFSPWVKPALFVD